MTDNLEKEELERISRQEDVQRALKQTSPGREPVKVKAGTGDKLWLGTYVIMLIALGGLYYLFSLQYFGLPPGIRSLLLRFVRGGAFVVLVLGASRMVDLYLIGSVTGEVHKYNLRRILRLLVAIILAFIVISVLFVNWYTAVLSLGLISLIMGFSLQTVLTSFLGWIYILVRAPYSVGDRIRIGEATGDVIDVSYLDTTLWEFGGQYLSTDHPSGRIIKFPNSRVLSTEVYNYSWPLFPYIWNEIKFNIAYESDLDFVAGVMQRAAEEEIGEQMLERVRAYRDLLAQTPVDRLDVREHPAVFFRVSENTWLEAIVRYLVEPRQAGRVKTRLINRLLKELNAAPDRVLFPKGDSR